MNRLLDSAPAGAASCVTATQLVRDFAAIRALVHQSPITVTSHSRADMVLLSSQDYQKLWRASETGLVHHIDARLSMILDTVETLVAILDSDLLIQRVNPAARRVFELGDEDIAGRPLKDLLDHRSWPFVAARIVEVYETARPDVIEIEPFTVPGRRFRVRIAPWPGGVAFLADDITDRDRAREAQARTSAMRAALDLLDSTGTGTVDARGRIADAAPALARMLGTTLEQLAGGRFTALFNPADRGTIEERMLEARNEAVAFDVSYLAGGTTPQPAQLILSPYWHGAMGPSFGFVLRNRA